MTTKRKDLYKDAERAAEHYFVKIIGCDSAQVRRAVRARFQAVDFWGCDIMGRDRDGYFYYAQVTVGAAEAVRKRRRNLEKFAWNEYDEVMVLQLVERPDPVNARRKEYFFRLHEYDHAAPRWLEVTEVISVPRVWFKKLRGPNEA